MTNRGKDNQDRDAIAIRAGISPLCTWTHTRKDVTRLFDELGIDREQPFELSHYSRMPSGLHLYGGWHYFCGSIESGPTSLAEVQQVAPSFQIALIPVRDAREPFPSSGCVQLDFYTEVPWGLDAPEPE